MTGSRPEGDKAERDDIGCIFLEESLGSELFWLWPVLVVVVDDVVSQSDQCSSRDVYVGELSFSLPVLDTLPIIPRHWPEHPKVFLKITDQSTSFLSPTDLDTGIEVGHVCDSLVVHNTIELVCDLVHLLQQCIEDVWVPGQIVAKSRQSVGGRLKPGSNENNALVKMSNTFLF